MKLIDSFFKVIEREFPGSNISLTDNDTFKDPFVNGMWAMYKMHNPKTDKMFALNEILHSCVGYHEYCINSELTFDEAQNSVRKIKEKTPNFMYKIYVKNTLLNNKIVEDGSIDHPLYPNL